MGLFNKIAGAFAKNGTSPASAADETMSILKYPCFANRTTI